MAETLCLFAYRLDNSIAHTHILSPAALADEQPHRISTSPLADS